MLFKTCAAVSFFLACVAASAASIANTATTTKTSPITGITYKLLPRATFATAAASCAKAGGRLAELATENGDEIDWLGTWISEGKPAWIGGLNGFPYKCAAVYAGGAVAIPKAKTGRGACYNLEAALCEMTPNSESDGPTAA